MAKHESTAINELIELAASQGPAVHDPEDLMFEPPKPRAEPRVRPPRMTATVPPVRGAGDLPPLPRSRAPHGTQQQPTLPPIPAMRSSTAPPTRGVTIPPLPPPPSTPVASAPESPNAVDVDLTPVTEPAVEPLPRAPLPPPRRTAAAPAARVSAATLAATSEPARITAPPIAARAIAPDFEVEEASEITELAWLEESHAHERLGRELDLPREEHTYVGIPRRMTTAQWLIKLAPWMGLMIVLGVAVGGYLAFDGQGNDEHEAAAAATAPAATEPAATELAAAEPAAAEPAAAEPAATEPAAAAPTAAEPAVVAPASTKGAQPTFVDVRIDTKPTGATVTLVDRGRSIYLGTTPLRTAVDPSRTYQLELTHPRREPQREALDPKSSTQLSIVLEKRIKRAAAETARVAAPAAPARIADRSPVKSADVKPAEVKPADVKPAAVKPADKAEAPAKTVAAAPTGKGILMLSSKPPCEIYVDGKATGLMTPQRALELPAGTHRITLVNPQQNVKKTFTVDITPDKPTRAIHDLMAP